MKLEYPKEWFLRSADIEDEAEIGAGITVTELDWESICGLHMCFEILEMFFWID